MKTKDEIRARFRVVECDGRYKIQVLRSRFLRKPIWRDARFISEFAPFSFDGVVMIHYNYEDAQNKINAAVNEIFAKQPDAWQEVGREYEKPI